MAKRGTWAFVQTCLRTRMLRGPFRHANRLFESLLKAGLTQLQGNLAGRLVTVIHLAEEELGNSIENAIH